MSNRPDDTAFNEMVSLLHSEPALAERMVFVDTKNESQVVVYPEQFNAEWLGSIRARLVKQKILKAVIHVGATSADQLGSRRSFVEYLPDERLYTIETHPAELVWLDAEEEDDPGSLFENGEEDK